MKIILLNFNLRECTEETSFYSDLIFPSFFGASFQDGLTKVFYVLFCSFYFS